MSEFIKIVEEFGNNYFYVKIDYVDNNYKCAKIIGKIENSSAKICKLETEENYKFRGIGRKLVKEFEEIAKEKLCNTITLTSSNTESDKFWNKMDNFRNEFNSFFIKDITKY